jgi:excisionase family DNA binding protein
MINLDKYPHYLTSAMVAEVFGVCVRTVVNMRKDGNLRFVRVGKRWLMDKQDLLEFIQSRRTK